MCVTQKIFLFFIFYFFVCASATNHHQHLFSILILDWESWRNISLSNMMSVFCAAPNIEQNGWHTLPKYINWSRFGLHSNNDIYCVWIYNWLETATTHCYIGDLNVHTPIHSPMSHKLIYSFGWLIQLSCNIVEWPESALTCLA